MRLCHRILHHVFLKSGSSMGPNVAVDCSLLYSGPTKLGFLWDQIGPNVTWCNLGLLHNAGRIRGQLLKCAFDTQRSTLS
jgi:hypothetical protein